MLRAIIGDVVGSRFEFDNTFDYQFELFTKECDFTDDSICTIAIADALAILVVRQVKERCKGLY